MKRLLVFSLLVLSLVCMFFYSGGNSEEGKTADNGFIEEKGRVFGTFYTIKYECDSSLSEGYLGRFEQINNSLSTFRPSSIISRFNSGDTTVVADEYFRKVFVAGQNISQTTGGAFDMTVAPIVNAWGFGFKKSDFVNEGIIDSLMTFVGYQKVRLYDNGRIVKDDNRLMLDASAIAKGFSVDVVSSFLDSCGVGNYMVEIGGEVVVKGVNQLGRPWGIGITKPIDDSTMMHTELQDVAYISSGAIATSGNYRQYYYKGGRKYSHTIDPRTGFPVSHSLLGATIYAPDCMTADAFATACMVVGLDSSIALINSLDGIEGFFITYNNEKGLYESFYTDGFSSLLKRE